MLRQSQREDDQIAAGNLAILTLARMINSFLIYKKAVLKMRAETLKVNPDLPTWMQMRRTMHEFDETLVINFDSLAFLFRPRTSQVMNHLVIAQGKYKNLVSLHKAHFAFMLELQEALAELAGDDHKDIDIEHALKRVPIRLQSSVEITNIALMDAFRTDEQLMLDALREFGTSLRSTLGVGRLVTIEIPEHLLTSVDPSLHV
ncbi:hypothetical protein ACO0LO_20640 [Undibacterium sp. TJN25]|uniref:hypothetical protein n=1 Tax=Undibacterium sp. TJN25 TaxID=3413056 RepID=UPI003BF26E2E